MYFSFNKFLGGQYHQVCYRIVMLERSLYAYGKENKPACGASCPTWPSIYAVVM